MHHFLVLIVLNYVMCQEINSGVPVYCQPNPDLQGRQCCIFPPFFTRDIARQCGAKTKVNLIDDVNNVTLKQRRIKTGCDQWKCILSKYSLITDDENVDDEKFFSHLDLWVELNPTFGDVTNAAKTHCKYNVGMVFPITPCGFFDLLQCLRNYINVDCPERLPTPECKELTEFYAKCKEYYFKK